MKKIGLMGCGMIADYGHIPAILATQGLEAWAVYDPNPEHAYGLQHKYGIPHGYAMSDMFFESGIEAVVVTSAAPAHRQNVEQAARYGLPVLCEKPLAMTDSDAASMIKTMDDAGLLLTTGFCYRFSGVSQNIKRLIQDGAIGEPRTLRLIYIWNLHGRDILGPDGKPQMNPYWLGRMNEGGPMVDCGVHQIDLARWWLDSDVDHYQAAGAWVEKYEAPDHMWLHLDHDNGAHTMAEMSFSYGHTVRDPRAHFSYHIIGTEGVIRYDREGWLFEVRTKFGTHQLPGSSEKDFEGMYAAFAHALETGDTTGLPTGYDGLRATQIARTATEAVIDRRWRGTTCLCGDCSQHQTTTVNRIETLPKSLVMPSALAACNGHHG
ncbi:Gfo/Idh/MocA family protein [Capsulimonas corticalis]|nr:Gfo/Idh/MocA family oxidoreductase [Capsulimonas corticalis]